MLKGREAYLQADEEALAYLYGLPLLAVHRNRGIDALVKTAPGEPPVFIRVQRRGEPLLDAAELLRRAGATKQPATLVLVATQEDYALSLFGTLPDEVTLVKSTPRSVRDALRDAVRAEPCR